MYKNFAKIYDLFMEVCDYEEWKNQVYAIADKYDKKTGELLDIGCGTGEVLLRTKDRYRCTGMDISTEMLKVAEKKLKKKDIPLFHADMINFNLGKKYDVCISLFDTVNHILDLNELASHFYCVKEHLNEGGIYIFDVVDREFMSDMFSNGSFVDIRSKITTIWEHELEEGIDYIDATYFVKNKQGTYDKYVEGYEKRVFTEQEIKGALELANLKLLEIIENNTIAGTRKFYVVNTK
ncbi:MAG: class I SAM-dependent DNA methyltransferase [Fusobacteriaceae bacterium]